MYGLPNPESRKFYKINDPFHIYIIICEIDCQSRFYAWDRVLRAGALGWSRGMGRGGKWEGVQEGGHMYIHGWFMSMYGKNHHNIVK